MSEYTNQQLQQAIDYCDEIPSIAISDINVTSIVSDDSIYLQREERSETFESFYQKVPIPLQNALEFTFVMDGETPKLRVSSNETHLFEQFNGQPESLSITAPSCHTLYDSLSYSVENIRTYLKRLHKETTNLSITKQDDKVVVTHPESITKLDRISFPIVGEYLYANSVTYHHKTGTIKYVFKNSNLSTDTEYINQNTADTNKQNLAQQLWDETYMFRFTCPSCGKNRMIKIGPSRGSALYCVSCHSKTESITTDEFIEDAYTLEEMLTELPSQLDEIGIQYSTVESAAPTITQIQSKVEQNTKNIGTIQLGDSGILSLNAFSDKLILSYHYGTLNTHILVESIQDTQEEEIASTSLPYNWCILCGSAFETTGNIPKVEYKHTYELFPETIDPRFATAFCCQKCKTELKTHLEQLCDEYTPELFIHKL